MEEVTAENLKKQLELVNKLNKEWEVSTDFDDTKKSVDLLMQKDKEMRVFRNIALPVKYNHQTNQYEFDIDCSLEEWLGY